MKQWKREQLWNFLALKLRYPRTIFCLFCNFLQLTFKLWNSISLLVKIKINCHPWPGHQAVSRIRVLGDIHWHHSVTFCLLAKPLQACCFYARFERGNAFWLVNAPISHSHLVSCCLSGEAIVYGTSSSLTSSGISVLEGSFATLDRQLVHLPL